MNPLSSKQGTAVFLMTAVPLAVIGFLVASNQKAKAAGPGLVRHRLRIYAPGKPYFDEEAEDLRAIVEQRTAGYATNVTVEHRGTDVIVEYDAAPGAPVPEIPANVPLVIEKLA
jgi:hypothetical protein